MQYSRVFFTLMQESLGYGNKGHTPTGRVILEKRGGECKITLTLQDLKPETNYKLYIMSSSEGFSGIEVGNVIVDERGKAELKKELSMKAMEESAITIDKVDIIGIAVVNKSEHTWVMAGYKGEVIRFKDKFNEVRKNTEYMPEPIKLEPVVETELELEPQPQPQPAPQPEPKARAEEFFDDIVSEPKELPKPEDESKHISFMNIAKKLNKEIEELEGYLKINPQNETANPQSPLEVIFMNHPKMEPFKNSGNKEFSEIKWVRISPRELITLPLNHWKYMNESFIWSAYRKYKHLILGEGTNKDEQKFYILGVPDIYKNEQNVYANRLGFKNFKTCDEHTTRENNHGYWVLEILHQKT